MSAPTYSVIFRGDLQPGYTVADVKANFARLFKAGPDTVEKLFSGRPLAIKKGLGQAQAEQLQATLTKLGAQSSLKPEGHQVVAPAAEASASPGTEPEAPISNVSEPENTPAHGPEPQASQEETAGSGFTLAPMEGYLLRENERRKVEPAQVSVSHLSLQPEGGNLVAESERTAVPPVQVEVPDWKLNTVATFKVDD